VDANSTTYLTLMQRLLEGSAGPAAKPATPASSLILP